MFSRQQKSIVIGLLLGDGHLAKRGRAVNASLIIKRSFKDIEYLKYHYNIFKGLTTAGGIKQKSYVDKRNGKTYHFCEFTLRACKELTKFYDKWYVDRKKIIPLDLKLDAESIATWFCDDGTIRKSKNNYFQIGFATNGFSINEVEFLRSLLSDRYSMRVGVSVAGIGRKTIDLSDYAARRLIKDIDGRYPGGMERKRKWIGVNFGIEHSSIAESASMRRQKTKEFIESNSKFSLLDFAKYLDWKFIRGSGKVEWDVQNSKRYLKEYLKNGTLIQNSIKVNGRKSLHYNKI